MDKVQKQMETELDFQEFDRSGHRARAHPGGRVLLEEGRALLKAAAETDIQAHCVVVVSDAARNLPLRTQGVLQYQSWLAVADLTAKLIAHCQGLGNLPRWAVKADLASGRLVYKAMVGGNQVEALSRPDVFKGTFMEA